MALGNAQAQPVLANLDGPAVQAPSVDSGPIRLRQTPRSFDSVETSAASEERAKPAPHVPGEFEVYVQRAAGAEVRRLGAELVTGAYDGRAIEAGVQVPPDYVVAPGDEILLLLWGSVDADLRLVVDRAGRINVPRVGTIQVAGVRHADLVATIDRRVGQVFKNYQVSATLGQLRSVRVFVTGFVMKPGAYTVSALSTVVSALMRSGGPSAAGSFRQIELRRGGALVARYDLYDLLLKGDRATDRLVQNGDVVHVGPVGAQVGVVGSVNRPVVAELKPGEGVADALMMAGGLSAVAERGRLAIERLEERNGQRIAELRLPFDANTALSHGDVLRAFSAVTSILPSQRQAKRVKVEGEVVRPAEYVLPEGSSIRDAIKAAGGLANAAYLYAAEFTRVSVQQQQQASYERALRDMETEFARVTGSRRVATTEDATTLQVQSAGYASLIERLRALKPTGRIVLQIAPGATELPDLALEDGDRLYIPARPSTVGVFGSVFNAASYLHMPGRTVDDYLRLAGGPTKGADEGSMFLIRANGDVVSARQSARWFSNSGEIRRLPTEPGDTVFVPEEMNKATLTQSAKEWTQVLFQFGLGVAGIVSATR